MEKIESLSILWGRRSEDLDDISIKLFESLKFLQEKLHNVYSRWYFLGNSKKDALSQQIELSVSNLKEILVTNYDMENPILGTRISLWNGEEDENRQAAVSARFNSMSTTVKNNFIIRFPEEFSLPKQEIIMIMDFIYKKFDGDNVRINGEEVPNRLNSPILLSEKLKVQPYKTHEGKDYTKEEWEAYEKQQWEDYKKNQ